jgi:hypothetical protein
MVIPCSVSTKPNISLNNRLVDSTSSPDNSGQFGVDESLSNRLELEGKTPGELMR